MEKAFCDMLFAHNSSLLESKQQIRSLAIALIAMMLQAVTTTCAMELDSKVKDESQSSEILIQDIETLKPYFEAIQKIRQTLERVAKKSGAQTGFVTSPRPHTSCHRTPKYLLLEVQIFDGDEILYQLYTPFGGIDLRTGVLFCEAIEITKNFLNKMHWKLKDITQHVSVYSCLEESNHKYNSVKSISKNKLYLITSVHGKRLFQEQDDEEELIIFDFINISMEQYNKDRSLFNELSQGKNCF